MCPATARRGPRAPLRCAIFAGTGVSGHMESRSHCVSYTHGVLMSSTRVLLAVAFAATMPSLLAAQATDLRQRLRADTGARQMCDMRYKLLMVTVVNAKGTPVPGVTVTVSGLPATSEGREPRVTSATGEAQFAEDSDMGHVSAGGTEVTLTLRKGRKVRRATLRIGHDAAGCHIALLSGSPTIRF